MPHQERPLRLLISAGEASGEMYGAELLDALQKRTAIESFGMGGDRMHAAGCELVVHAKDVAVVGLAEVLSHLPRIYGEFHKLLREVDRRRPDLAVLIDFPDWNFRLARQLHRRGIPVVYYVSPQLWAWRKGRLKLVQKYVDKMLVIIPFEREFYRDHGVEVEFVGHPLGALEAPAEPRESFAQRWGLNPEKHWIALLPGSRRKELLMNLPAMVGAAQQLGAEYEYLIPVASTLDREWVEQQVAAASPGDSPRFTFTDDARSSLLHSRAAVVASGTATVEAAVIGTPFVMVYRVSPMTWRLGRYLVKLPHYGMVNLIAGRRVVPELIQDDFTPGSVTRELRKLLDEGPDREAMIAALAEVRRKLRNDDDRYTTADRAAEAVLHVAESFAATGNAR